jgi:hypothetical protein
MRDVEQEPHELTTHQFCFRAFQLLRWWAGHLLFLITHETCHIYAQGNKSLEFTIVVQASGFTWDHHTLLEVTLCISMQVNTAFTRSLGITVLGIVSQG